MIMFHGGISVKHCPFLCFLSLRMFPLSAVLYKKSVLSYNNECTNAVKRTLHRIKSLRDPQTL